MKILALDIGTQLGWARLSTGRGAMGVGELTFADTVLLGTEKNLRHAKKLRMDRRLDIRALALALWLEDQTPDWCVFEDVRFASSQAAAHLWGTLRGVIWSWAGRKGINIDSLDTGKLKKWTTGSGAADKPAMLAAVRRRWPDDFRPSWDDNAVDAFCLLRWARETIKV